MSDEAKKQGIDYSFVGMSMSEIKEFLVATFMGGVRRGRKPKAPFIWGPPGAGKTFTTYAAARKIGRALSELWGRDVHCEMYDVPTSCLEPCDISGVPFPVKIEGEETFSRYLGPDWAWFTSVEYEEHERVRRNDPKWQAPPAILFFDDLVAAHFQTQSAFFKGVHEGKWGNLHQRDNVMVVGAGNRAKDNAAANDMPTALANRFRHCYACPTPDDWLKWAGDFREDGEDGIKGESRIHPLVIGFIRTCKDDLNEFSEEVAVREEKAFASARTWEDVSELLYEGYINQENKIFSKSVMGIIGRGVATKFAGFLRAATKLVPPDEICRDPHKARVPGKQNLDALHATVSSLEAHLRTNPKQWEAGLIYAMRDEMVSDVGILLAGTVLVNVIMKLDPKERAKAQGSKLLAKAFDRYSDLLEVIE